MADRLPASNAAQERDPFANDVLERLIRSNQEYQRTHGHYIVALAERLLALRVAVQEVAAFEDAGGDDWWGAHSKLYRAAGIEVPGV